MADVSISNWQDLVTEMNAARDSDIILTADIDLNEYAETGITGSLGNTAYTKVLDGNGRKIKNIYCRTNIPVFKGAKSRKMSISNVDFDGVYLQSGWLFDYANISNCLINAEITDTYLATSGVTYEQCGIKVSGFGTTARLQQSVASDVTPFKYSFCNIELNGNFDAIAMNLQNSYVSGDFTKGGSIFTLKNSNVAVFNATVTSESAMNAGLAKFLLVNSDRITLPQGSSLPSTVTPVTTSELQSAGTLRNTYGFPIR